MTEAAIANIVTGIVTITITLVGFFSLWLKLRYGEDRVRAVEDKVDHNTTITKNATDSAKVAASQAADNAQDAKAAAEDAVTRIEKKLNGGLSHAIAEYIRPLEAIVTANTAAIKAHVEDYQINMTEVRRMLSDFISGAELKQFSDYVHQRNHDMLNALEKQSLKMELLTQVLTAKQSIESPKGTS